jgi:hypothetical protein
MKSFKTIPGRQKKEKLMVTGENSYSMKCFKESPRKTGKERPLERIDAFDLFTLFTADIMRKRVTFTR